uniref:AMP-dependent synthetase/ligase domain-containing protein n=1 Tax=Araucaria cunninghamii TaxID=56994 RepID=A0A0D6QXI5_ARACU
MDAEVVKSVTEVGVDDIIQAGLPSHRAEIFHGQLQRAIAEIGGSETSLWQRVSKELLTPNYPHALHQLMYYSIYKNWDSAKNGPPLGWFPTQEAAILTNLGRLMEAHGPQLLGSSYHNPITSFSLFQQFTVDNPEVYWPLVLKELSVVFHESPRCILDTSDKSQPVGVWLPGSVLNVAESCLSPKESMRRTDNSIAIIWRKEGHDEYPVNKMTLGELRARVMQVANALDVVFTKGDAIAIDMPMTVNAVVIYLALILAGYVVVSIADSFVPKEIATRIRVSKAKGIFTQDFIVRGGRRIPLYSRVVESGAPKAIVIPAEEDVGIQLRENDITWSKFLSFSDHLQSPEYYLPVRQPMDAMINILFSSGTSGEPKAIPWTQAPAIRCAAQCWEHLDVKAGDVFCWPTNLGWVMGPVLIFSSFLTGATAALYEGSPLDRGFGKFVQDAGVNVLGTVPSMVKTWKRTGCMEGLEWSQIRTFASTGEASSVDDDLWLSSKAWYKPVIDLCGGTELSACYIHGSLLQPQAFAMFSTATMTTGFVLLDDQQIPYPNDQPCIGEIGLFPTFFGASSTLLNGDHDAVYFKGMPVYKGMRLRRHGDMIERTVGGYYRAHGRSDDTMNLGGIKTSAIEIERVCNRAHEQISETAAISIPSPGGGPEKLAIVAVLKDGPTVNLDTLKLCFSKAIQNNLNPLFKVSYVKVVSDFPRTASNKILRRVLRDLVKKEVSAHRSRL